MASDNERLPTRMTIEDGVKHEERGLVVPRPSPSIVTTPKGSVSGTASGKTSTIKSSDS